MEITKKINLIIFINFKKIKQLFLLSKFKINYDLYYIKINFFLCC